MTDVSRCNRSVLFSDPGKSLLGLENDISRTGPVRIASAHYCQLAYIDGVGLDLGMRDDAQLSRIGLATTTLAISGTITAATAT